jgi:hypothetical protein
VITSSPAPGLENRAVSGEGGDDVRVGVRKRVLGVRPQQESKGSLGESGHGGKEVEIRTRLRLNLEATKTTSLG